MARLRKLDLGRLAILLVLVIGAAALFTKDRWDWILDDDEAQTQGVAAPEIDDVDDATERLYRIAPDNGSQVSYRVEERLAGAGNTAVGTTTVVAGDIAVNTVDPTQSRIGEIVVNVEMFDSDSSLRDKRIRHDYLESTSYPFARFVPTAIDGLDVTFADGDTYDISITGDLTVKETTRSETFAGSVTVDTDRITADVSAMVLGSNYDVGPIDIPRLAHTSDEITLVFELVADRVELGSVGDADLERDLAVADISGGAFAEDVQPVLEQNCVSCHTSDGPGWDTLPMDTAADVAAIAPDIKLVTQINYMPPWLPGGDSPAFEHDWSLTDDEKATLAAWADAGGGLDVAPDTPLVARGQAIIPIDEDQKIAPRDGPYTTEVDENGEPVLADEYRCQVHEVADPEGDGTWVKGFEFRPDQTAVVHHSIVYRVPAAAAEEIAAKAGADGRPGWTCFGLSGLQTDGVRSIQGWAPGQSPTIYPDGYGIYLAPGDMIVNQIHFHFDHDAPADNSWIILDTATPEEAARMQHITGATYLTPAEVPCTPEEQAIAEERAATIDGYVNLCIRENVIEDIRQKYDNFATFIPGALILSCGGTVDDYDDLDGSVGYSSCDKPAQNTGTIHTVLGHMHEFGKSYRMTLHPDTPEEKVLLDIPVWDFEWQLNYDPVEDIRIERGDIVRFECWWDRSLKQMEEPRYITWNEGTVDEMCFSSISVLPDGPVTESDLDAATPSD